MMELKTSNPRDSEIKTLGEVSLRRDIYEFIKFIRDRDVVLTKRENSISVPVARKLSKLMSFKEDQTRIEDKYTSSWIDFIYNLCKELNLVNKEVDGWVDNITGCYFRRWERPAYPEFDIHLIEENWDKYLEIDPFEKERKILSILFNITKSEFYTKPIHQKEGDQAGRFSIHGSGVNAQNEINYPFLRNKLLYILGLFDKERWYEVGSLTGYIKNNYPNQVLDHNNRSHVREDKNFYHCFYETRDKRGWGREIEVKEGDVDAFERVEGRYITYFLETIPFMMNLVELSYARSPSEIMPPRDYITHFRLTSHGKELLSGVLQRDKPSHIKILPTFEIFIPWDEFDEKIMIRLERYVKTLTIDKMYHLKIYKKGILSELERGEGIEDVINFFEDLAGLPQNIRYELESYGRHSEKIVCLPNTSIIEVLNPETSGILESSYPGYIVSRIDERYFLIKKVKKFYEKLLIDGRLPRMIDYSVVGRKLNLHASGDLIELKSRDSDVFLKKRLMECASFIKTDGNKQIYKIKPDLKVTEKDFLRSNISGELPDSLKKTQEREEKPAIDFDMVYLVYSEDKGVMNSLKKFLKNKGSGHHVLGDKIIVNKEDIKTVKTYINGVGESQVD